MEISKVFINEKAISHSIDIQYHVICLYLKIPHNFMSLIFKDRFWLVHIAFGIWSDFNLLHKSQWITFPTQQCLVLYCFSASLLHPLIKGYTYKITERIFVLLRKDIEWIGWNIVVTMKRIQLRVHTTLEKIIINLKIIKR